jgi:hypothetical protein
MIRPITLVCWILALGAGLYLYHAKHEVELMDRHIDEIAKQTAQLRVESRGLLDEWIRLGEPEQLHKYSDEYLGLQPIAPSQFARVSDLAARLPPPQPDPPEDQADVVAQSSGSASAGVASPDDHPSGIQAGAVQLVPAAPAAADPESETATGGDDIPVPPIPPATLPVATTTASAVTALPLQARPVSSRLADGQTEPERTRADASSPGTEEPHAVAAKVTPATPGEPHQRPPGLINAEDPGAPARGLPPLQAQGPRDVAGLPPQQAQGPIGEMAPGPARVPAQGQEIVRTPGQAGGSAIAGTPSQSGSRPADAHTADARTADNRANQQPRETRPIEPQPTEHLAAAPRGTAIHGGRLGQAQTEQAEAGPSRMAPVQGSSLLGMSRGSVPLPLPAPTPVDANWSGPAGTGSLGPGR